MPSPFPGMDPYLEDPLIWPDFHNRFAEKISDTLNQRLPPPYYAQLETREEVGISDEPAHRVIVPDVSVRGHVLSSGLAANSQVAVLEPRVTLSESLTLIVETEPTRLSFVEIRDSRRGHEVVTLIEILSPANKKRGRDREKFLEKRAEILDSHTSLVEIDLLRTGDRAWTDPVIAHQLFALEPAPHYLATINRSWQRGADMRLDLFPAFVTGVLPVVPIPLRESEDEAPLDLQFVFQLAYQSGPYWRGAVDYSQPANPPLPEALREWAAERVRTWNERRTAE